MNKLRDAILIPLDFIMTLAVMGTVVSFVALRQVVKLFNKVQGK